jgi:hypothetical protein
MKRILKKQYNNPWKIVEGKWLFLLLVFFWLGGCSLWNSYLHPDYESTRADRLCHPYGDCSQGTWVAVNGSTKDLTEAKTQCHDEVDQRTGNGWWEDSVSRGLEIGTCLEKKGYRLQQ